MTPVDVPSPAQIIPDAFRPKSSRPRSPAGYLRGRLGSSRSGDQGMGQGRDFDSDWIAVLDAVITAPPDIVTTSMVLVSGDDSFTSGQLATITGKFQALTALGITCFTASGDDGALTLTLDTHVHVQYPGSDPWVTSCGGTTISTNPFVCGIGMERLQSHFCRYDAPGYRRRRQRVLHRLAASPGSRQSTVPAITPNGSASDRAAAFRMWPATPA